MTNKKTHPLISVWMVTYNHEIFIEQAIESVMMQVTHFPFKLFIGEDSSTDRTRKICQKLKEKYPSKIELFSHESNIGANANGIFMYEQCFQSNAKYIALLEGDDYWTDPLKLQKQVDFLEANPTYTICFHRVQLLTNEVLEPDMSVEARYNKIEKLPATAKDLIEQGNFIHTPSVVFRNVLEEFPFEFKYSTVGDYFLYIILSQKGPIKRLDDIMAVYRNNVGIYSTLTDAEMNRKIAVYQSCILSYLKDPELKEIMLKKQLALLNTFKPTTNEVDLTLEQFSNRLDMKSLWKILTLKIKKLF
ncbi:glycosyltransferase family 2 protein [Ulvibacter antarcticus]|uniref:Glycosyl transferase family 2 n=1 Tax=Ulvibacter antarcticus TaxID=442714 RepID=A0A3L9YU28_9FLAO|nr:glycosyltransferase [Ulvibacter antarcticus]RMA57972.1 glycosyl transferase family 2 [Ulvibacter antarcticus]